MLCDGGEDAIEDRGVEDCTSSADARSEMSGRTEYADLVLDVDFSAVLETSQRRRKRRRDVASRHARHADNSKSFFRPLLNRFGLERSMRRRGRRCWW